MPPLQALDVRIAPLNIMLTLIYDYFSTTWTILEREYNVVAEIADRCLG